MTLIIDTNDGLDGVISLSNSISGTWELKSSYVSPYSPAAIDSTNNVLKFRIDSESDDRTATFAATDTLDVSAMVTVINTALGATYAAVGDADALQITFTAAAGITIKYAEATSTASLLFTNSGQNRELETGEVITLQLRDRSTVDHLKVYIDETWHNNVTTSGETPTFVIPVENLVEIPGQTMDIAGSTSELTVSVREYGSSADMDFDTMPTVTLVLNKI